MNKSTNAFIQSMREKKIPEQQIFDFVKSKPEYQGFANKMESEGKNKNEIDTFMRSQLNIPDPYKRTPFQEAYRTSGLWGTAFKTADWLKSRYGVGETLSDIASLPGIALAGAASLPREALDYLPNLIKQQNAYEQENFGELENPFSGYLDKLKSYLPSHDPSKLPSTQSIDNFLTNAKEYLPTYQEAKNFILHGNDQPKGPVGGLLESTTAAAGSGALFGPVGAVLGGVLGAANYVGENIGMSPAKRALMTPGKVGPSYPPTVNLPKKAINSAQDLAVRLISNDPSNINFSAMQAAQELGIPLENVPIQSITKGGLPNVIEGVMENTLLGQKRFNEMLGHFTGDMKFAIEQVIDSIPIDSNNLAATTVEHLGQPVFENSLPAIVNQAAPILDIPRYQAGQIGRSFLAETKENAISEYKNAYNEVKFEPTDILEPTDRSYGKLRKVVRDVKNELSSKGFKGKQRKEAIGVIKEIEKLFEVQSTPSKILGSDGKPLPNQITRLPISLENIKKNINDLNKKISFDEPTLVNLVSPIAKEMRNIISDKARGNPRLEPLIEANRLFGEFSETYNKNPIVRRLGKMTDEQFYRAVKNQPTYLEEFRKIAEKTDNWNAYNELRGRIIADVMEGPLTATTPEELAKSVTPSLIKQMRELEPFYPELQGITQGLQQAANHAKQFNTPQSRLYSKIREEILEDITLDSNFERTLNRMNSPAGIEAVRKAAASTPEGQNIINNLERKKVEQIIYNGTKKRSISLSDLADVFNDERNDTILKHILSKENYKQAKNIGELAKGYVEGQKVGKGLKKHAEKGLALTALGLGASVYLLPMLSVPTLGIGLVSRWMNGPNFKKSLINNIKDIQKNQVP